MLIEPHMRVEIGDSAIDIWPFALAILISVLIILWLRKYRLSHLLCIAVFGMYLLFVLDKVFFPITISGYYADSMRQVPFDSFINLVPFSFGGATLEDAFMTMLQNVLLTIPFGFGLSFVVPVRAKYILWIALAVGLGIELTQLVIALLLQYPYRYIDINDVLMNTLGVLIGYLVFRIFAWLYLWLMGSFTIKRGGLPAYIAAVATRTIDNSHIIP